MVLLTSVAPASLRREPRPERVTGRADLRRRAPLLVVVGERGISRAEVHGRDAEAREARDVGPAVLRRWLAARRGENRVDERCRRRVIEPGPRAPRSIGHHDLETRE